MSLKALITTLVIGSSSVALAAPVVRDHRTHEPAPIATTVDHRSSIDIYAQADISVRPRPLPLPPAPQPAPLSWVTLANDAKVAGRTTIKIPQGTRAFTKLELRAEGYGNAQIEKVLITFGNGQTQTVNVNKRLSKYDSSFSIDLTGNTRYISKVVLVGKGNAGRRGATVDVLAI